TVRVIGPAVSCSAEIGTIPVLLIRPTVGLMPTMPQACAGLTIDPSVSVPTASGASPAATATAEPELDPDGLRPEPCGLTAWPPSVDQPLDDWVERKLAHSDRLALPRMTASAARSLPIRKASAAAAPASAGEPAVAGEPATEMLTLIRTGIPASGPSSAPAARAWSTAAACSAASRLTEITAPSPGLWRSIRSRQKLTSSPDVSVPAAIAWLSPATVTSARLMPDRPMVLPGDSEIAMVED